MSTSERLPSEHSFGKPLHQCFIVTDISGSDSSSSFQQRLKVRSHVWHVTALE